MRDLYVPGNSPLHRLDARVKLALTVAFVLALSLSPVGAWPAYVLFLALALAAALLSGLGIGFVLKRALLALPFVLAALPLIFTGPQPRVAWALTPALNLPVSPAGLERFASIALRSWISVQAAILLAATTHFPSLLAALRALRVPALFVTIIELMWRYLFVLVEEATRLLRARTSRSAAPPAHGARRTGGGVVWRGMVTGGMAGSLFLRSLERSDRVYAAMLARGYNGQPAGGARMPALTRQARRSLVAGLAALALVWLVGVLAGG